MCWQALKSMIFKSEGIPVHRQQLSARLRDHDGDGQPVTLPVADSNATPLYYCGINETSIILLNIIGDERPFSSVADASSQQGSMQLKLRLPAPRTAAGALASLGAGSVDTPAVSIGVEPDDTLAASLVEHTNAVSQIILQTLKRRVQVITGLNPEQFELLVRGASVAEHAYEALGTIFPHAGESSRWSVCLVEDFIVAAMQQVRRWRLRSSTSGRHRPHRGLPAS
jgi:hypothetical protein